LQILAQATAELVKGLKSEAEGVGDKDLQRRLLAASKQLADATTRLVDAAKLCAAQPQDPNRRQAMRDAAVNIRDLAQQTTYEDEKIHHLKKLETLAKRVASASTQTISASQTAAPSNANQGSQQNLLDQCRIVADRLSRLIQAIKLTSLNPNDQLATAQLIQNCEDIIYPAEELVNAAKAAVPTVQDPAAANRLRESANNLSIAVGELRSGLNKVKELYPPSAEVNVDAAMSVIQSLERDLDAFKRAAQTGALVPIPEETASIAGSRLQASAKQVSSATVQLLNASTQADESFIADATQNVARSLQDLSAAARGVAAAIPDDRQSQLRMLDSAQEVVERSAYLVDSVREAFGKSGDPVVQSKLVDAAREVANALNRCLNCLPDHRDITKAIKTIEETSQRLVSSELIIRPSRTLVAEVFIDLNNAATYLNEAAGDVVTSTYGSTEQLGNSAEHYSEVYRTFVDGGLQIVSTETDVHRRQEVIHGLQDVSTASTRLLALAKQTHGQSYAPHMKNQLTAAARAVTESINNLLTYCAQSLPGQKECDNAIRRIQQLRTLLDNCAVPVNTRSYYESLDAVLESSRVSLIFYGSCIFELLCGKYYSNELTRSSAMEWLAYPTLQSSIKLTNLFKPFAPPRMPCQHS
jgi:talin